MDSKLQFFKEATKAFKAENEAADRAYTHGQNCFVCRGLKSRVKPWRWAVNFLFQCGTIHDLLVEHAAKKVEADGYRVGLDEFREPEVPSLAWLDGLFALRDDRSE